MGIVARNWIGALDEQMATASALKHLFGSLFGSNREKGEPQTHTSLMVGKSPGTASDSEVLHQCNWGRSLRMTENIQTPHKKPNLKAWLQN